eukprot:TRINITY_DN1685_c0_g1_i1.p1 TRINITY_DN1685_c0_g1~~TRINITY_DN1685_c0_g1_i1.p1  ORF type:complete len:220 (+),score=37.66 TRINITY_DN1685_c0_g1_i1:81-740(+)
MPPKTGRHANKTAWVAHKHQPSLAVTDDKITGWDASCCEKCIAVLEWRRKYGKYKMLTVPGRCNGCKNKCVKAAYHQLCQPCASAKKLCAKCVNPYEVPQEELDFARREAALRKAIVNLPERYRRSAERKLDKEEVDLDAVEAIVRKATQRQGARVARPAKPAAADSSSDSDSDKANSPQAKRSKTTPVTSPSAPPAELASDKDAKMDAHSDSDSDEIM